MKIINHLRRPLLPGVALLRRFEARNSLLVFSEPRGGSTWLTEILAQIPASAVIWEPLNPGGVPELRRMGFDWRQFIPRDAIWEEASDFMERVLTGRVLNRHTSQASTLAEFIKARQLIVKFCRGNALLPWITQNFQFDRMPIYLLRHPMAVVASQLKHGAWAKVSTAIGVPTANRYPQIYQEHADFLSRIETMEEKLVAMWCISNIRPLATPEAERRWLTVFYEDLVMEPERVLTRVESQWNLKFPAEIFPRIRQASSTVKHDALAAEPARQLAKWRDQFTPGQIKAMQAVLREFNMGIYTDDPMPVKEIE